MCTGVFYFSRPVPFLGGFTARSGNSVFVYMCNLQYFFQKHKLTLCQASYLHLQAVFVLYLQLTSMKTTVGTAVETDM